MRIRSRSVIAASLGLAALLIGYSVLQSREPTYKGRTMQQWLFEGENSESAREALLHLGTNNLPLLIRRLSYDPAKTPL